MWIYVVCSQTTVELVLTQNTVIEDTLLQEGIFMWIHFISQDQQWILLSGKCNLNMFSVLLS